MLATGVSSVSACSWPQAQPTATPEAVRGGRLSRGVGRSSRVGETQGKRRFVLTFSAQLAFPVGFFLSADLSS